MRQIELEIRRAGRLVRTYHFSGPSSWQELTAEHLLEWASVMYSKERLQQAKGILAARLFGIPRHLYLKALDRKERYRLSITVEFLFRRNLLHTWLMPTIRLGLRRYHGPKSKLGNLVIEEFGMTELCYQTWERNQDPESLDMLAAILYRPRRWLGVNDDIRAPFTVSGIEKRAARFKRLPLRVKIAILLNYEGCRNYIHDRNPQIFKKGEAPVNGKPSITPWATIIRSGAGGIFGTLAETERVNIHKFLVELNTRLKKAEKENS